MNAPQPIDDLAATLAALDAISHHSTRKLLRVESNRVNLLVVHAVAALVIGPLFAASSSQFRGPTWQFLRYLPAFPHSLVVLMLCGGLVLLVGTLADRVRIERTGIALLACWYLLITGGFLLPVLNWLSKAMPVYLDSGSWPASNRPSFYAWAVYAHLSTIMCVHLWTLWRMGRDELARPR